MGCCLLLYTQRGAVAVQFFHYNPQTGALPIHPALHLLPGEQKIEYYLEKHKQIVHNINPGKSRLKHCEWPGCDFQTTRFDAMAKHKRLHTGEIPHPCVWPDCGKGFQTKTLLNRHLLIHKDLKPFACVWPGCQYRCRISANLKTHLKVHQK